jgi:hypothetical protein
MTLTTGANPYCEFNVTNQTQGQANFTVYVNDSAGNLGANTTYYYFVVDTAPPYFDSNLTPEEGNTSYSTAQTFSFTAYSYASSTLNCSLIVDGATAATNESTANATPTTLNATLAVGTHAWNVSCAGGAGNSNSTDTRNITILQESTGSQSVGGRFIPSPSPSPPTPSPTTAILTPTATPRASPQPPRASVQPTVPTTVKPPASNEEQEESWWPATREGTARGISVVQETIKIADSKNMDVDEAKRLVALAQHALDRGDYAAASEYLKQSEDALRKAGVSVSHPPSTKNAGFDWQTAGAAAAAIAVAAAAAGALLYLRRKREL